MRIAVINPPRVRSYPVCREDRLEYIDYGEIFPPLTLLTTAAILEKAGYQILAIDANGWDLPTEEVEKKIIRFKPDLLLTRFAIDTIPNDAQVVKAAKKSNPKCVTLVRCKIISDSPLLQKETLSRYPIDFLINGDMEVITPLVAKNLKDKKSLKKIKGLIYFDKGKIKRTGPAPRIKNINRLPFPAYHLTGGINCYQTGTQQPPFTNIFSSRGCPYSCKFCSSHDTYMPRTPKNVVDELEWLVNDYGLKNFYFFDDTFTLDQKRAEGVCREILKRNLKLRWSCGTRVDTVTPKLLKLMKKAGCWLIAYGVESGSQKVLNRNRKSYRISTARKAIKDTQKAGIFAYAMFVLGFPGETEETIEETIQFAIKTNPDYAQFCIAVPFPNTPFYDEYHEKEWITTQDWTKYNPLGHPVISTPKISDKQLHRLHYQAYRRFLLRPKFLLNKLSSRNWRWNLVGANFLANRLRAIIKRSLIR